MSGKRWLGAVLVQKYLNCSHGALPARVRQWKVMCALLTCQSLCCRHLELISQGEKGNWVIMGLAGAGFLFHSGGSWSFSQS